MTKNRLVYSTDSGSICPECSRPVASCNCKHNARKLVLGDGKIKLRRETKGRGGKTVSIISGLGLNLDQMHTLLSELKRLCGAGGTIKEGEIEIQGEHLDKIRAELIKRGYKPKG